MFAEEAISAISNFNITFLPGLSRSNFCVLLLNILALEQNRQHPGAKFCD